MADPNARTLCSGSAFQCATGAVFIYQEFDGRLELVQTLVPPDVSPYDFFGTSIDTDGDRLIVGGMGAAWPGVGFRQGVAYIYELEDGEWFETGRLQPPAEVAELFGAGVYLSGDVALVKSSRPANVYRYEFADGEWILSEKFHPPAPLVSADCFGCAGVALDEWIFLSAYFESTVSSRAGAVYAYRKRADNTLEFVQKIESPGTRGFGVAIDFDGQTLAIGAALSEREFELQGIVQTYSYDGQHWLLEQEITHDPPMKSAVFGISVAIQGDMLLATEGATRTATVEGRVLRFERRPGNGWQQVSALVPDPPIYARRYGQPVVMRSGHALAGAPDEIDASGSQTGAAYFFDLTCGNCPADIDADGTLTIFDFLTFLNLFEDGDTTADFDGDGELTLFDFLAFQTAFDAGCE